MHRIVARVKTKKRGRSEIYLDGGGGGGGGGGGEGVVNAGVKWFASVAFDGAYKEERERGKCCLGKKSRERERERGERVRDSWRESQKRREQE